MEIEKTPDTQRCMFITINHLRELMLKAFKTGQNKSNDYPAKHWVEEEIYKLKKAIKNEL